MRTETGVHGRVTVGMREVTGGHEYNNRGTAYSNRCMRAVTGGHAYSNRGHARSNKGTWVLLQGYMLTVTGSMRTVTGGMHAVTGGRAYSYRGTCVQ
ncbi:hypothetical protein DPMN_176752 [Dreissena polymorpha]|uniref:Uncharacterized protein n=1 Tax=Dreissena polymorpha TaxID=45954 RepID=A0A9D4E8X0_DREPO|nr:hypothetical protein DPMN_176752 [Dreissena polymorpha]